MKKIIWLVYNLLLINLPDRKVTKKIKHEFMKRMIKACGRNVSANRGSRFASDLVIGDDSGIGENSIIYPNVSIGKNVLIAREVLINPENHRIDINKILTNRK